MREFGVLLFAGLLLAIRLPAAEAIPEAEFRGRVVCLPEEMHRVHQTDLPARHEHIWALRTTDGTYHTLLRTQLSEAIFLDERIRKKELLLKGRVFPKTQVLEVTSMKSLINGVVHDLYYWCDICAIHSVSPAECACCQGPVQLKEEPAK
jgi:hypothetical protein